MPLLSYSTDKKQPLSLSLFSLIAVVLYRRWLCVEEDGFDALFNAEILFAVEKSADYRMKRSSRYLGSVHISSSTMSSSLSMCLRMEARKGATRSW